MIVAIVDGEIGITRRHRHGDLACQNGITVPVQAKWCDDQVAVGRVVHRNVIEPRCGDIRVLYRKGVDARYGSIVVENDVGDQQVIINAAIDT